MAKPLPYFPIYPGDWFKDPNLKRCSHAAKGVFMDTLCIMWQCESRGVLSTGNCPWSDKEWAAAVGCNMDVTVACIDELLCKGVFHKDITGAVCYMPWVLEEEERRKVRVRVKKHRCNTNVTPLMKCESENEIKGLMEEEFEEKPIREIYYPEHFRNKPFLRVWSEWIHYRKARAKCPDPLTMFQKQILANQEFSCEEMIAAIEKSMESGWQGIFPAKSGAPATNGKHQSSLYDLRTVRETKEKQAQDLKNRYCSEGPLADSWNSQEHKARYFKLKKEISEINQKIGAFKV